MYFLYQGSWRFPSSQCRELGTMCSNTWVYIGHSLFKSAQSFVTSILLVSPSPNEPGPSSSLRPGVTIPLWAVVISAQPVAGTSRLTCFCISPHDEAESCKLSRNTLEHLVFATGLKIVMGSAPFPPWLMLTDNSLCVLILAAWASLMLLELARTIAISGMLLGSPAWHTVFIDMCTSSPPHEDHCSCPFNEGNPYAEP